MAKKTLQKLSPKLEEELRDKLEEMLDEHDDVADKRRRLSKLLGGHLKVIDSTVGRRMRPPVLRLLADELIVDSFAGGGGASTGIEMATGRSPDIAVNHDPEAIAMHAANHPTTKHFCESVWTVDPKMVCGGRKVALAWFSPDCKHFSKAKGGKPVEKKIRGLAWVVVRWAKAVKPRVIILENVEEFQDWGPLLDDGRPCPLRRGLTFRRWIGQLRASGYQVETRELRAMDYGAPTSRKRLFVIARSDGLPIVWPEPTHGPGRLPYRTAAECISWDIPCPSIFERTRPLAEATQRRIARGIRRYVVEAADPFIVPLTHQGDDRAYPIDEPMRTVTGAHRGELALVTPTVTAVDHHSLVQTSLMLKLRGGLDDHQVTAQDLRRPAPTVTAGGTHLAEVRAFLVKYYGTDQAPQLRLPLDTITSHDRFGLVVVRGQLYVIDDIGMRMLWPRELFRAQSFPDSYQIQILYFGKPLSKTAQVRMVGNSVPPVMAEALVRAQFAAADAARSIT